MLRDVTFFVTLPGFLDGGGLQSCLREGPPVHRDEASPSDDTDWASVDPHMKPDTLDVRCRGQGG